jgi:hypothetical protein
VDGVRALTDGCVGLLLPHAVNNRAQAVTMTFSDKGPSSTPGVRTLPLSKRLSRLKASDEGVGPAAEVGPQFDFHSVDGCRERTGCSKRPKLV